MSQKTAPMPVANAVPLTMTMERVLGSLDVVSVQQTPRGCIQECLGCSAKSEYRLYGGMRQDFHTAIFPGKRFEGSDPEQIGHMLEESPFCPDRCFWGGMRKFKMPITVPDQNGETMMMLEKQFSFPTHCIIHLDDDIVIPCCCNLPTLKVFTPDGTYVGKTKYACDMCLWVDKCAAAWCTCGCTCPAPPRHNLPRHTFHATPRHATTLRVAGFKRTTRTATCSTSSVRTHAAWAAARCATAAEARAAAASTCRTTSATPRPRRRSRAAPEPTASTHRYARCGRA
jgi:hypothetical protein